MGRGPFTNILVTCLFFRFSGGGGGGPCSTCFGSGNTLQEQNSAKIKGANAFLPMVTAGLGTFNMIDFSTSAGREESFHLESGFPFDSFEQLYQGVPFFRGTFVGVSCSPGSPKEQAVTKGTCCLRLLGVEHSGFT